MKKVVSMVQTKSEELSKKEVIQLIIQHHGSAKKSEQGRNEFSLRIKNHFILYSPDSITYTQDDNVVFEEINGELDDIFTTPRKAVSIVHTAPEELSKEKAIQLIKQHHGSKNVRLQKQNAFSLSINGHFISYSPERISYIVGKDMKVALLKNGELDGILTPTRKFTPKPISIDVATLKPRTDDEKKAYSQACISF